MKKLLFIIPLCIALSASAQSSRTKKPLKEKESSTLTSLDGKSFKVTLQSRKGDAGNSTSSTSVSRTPQTQAGISSSTQGSDYNTAGTPSSAGAGNSNPNVVSGEISSNNLNSGAGTGSTSGTSYQSGSQTGNTSQPHQNPAGVGAMDNASPSSTTGANTGITQGSQGSGTITGTSRDLPPNVANDNANTTAPVDNTSSTTTSGIAPTAAPTLEGKTEESLANKKMILTFDNGTINSSTLSSKGVQDCPYHVNSSDGNILSFSSNCKSSGSQVRAMWSGIAEGNSIHGTFTWTSEDGQNISYTFTGTTASQKEIDASRELGVR